MIRDALQKESTRATLGAIVSADIHDKSTERGGVVAFERGQVEFREEFSHSQNDGNYKNLLYPYFNGAMANFHMHALSTDCSAYAGPSGHLRADGDIGCSDTSGASGVVLTTMGHPAADDGRQLTDRLQLNVDVYFIQRGSDGSKTLRVVDIGTYAVPYRRTQN